MMKQNLLIVALCLLCTTASAQGNKNKSWSWLGFERPAGVNPILTPDSNSVFYCPMHKAPLKWEEGDTFNPAATVMNGRVVVLYRAEDKTAMGIGKRTSRIGFASSADGIHFTRHGAPVLFPGTGDYDEYDVPGGCEDPRVAMTADGLYVMMYTEWNRKCPRLSVATSRDLVNWKKHGPAFRTAYNGKFLDMASKSGSIVTEVKNGKQTIARINGKYYMYWGEQFVNIATSTDLINWTPMVDSKGELLKVMKPRKGFFDSLLTECGPPAIITPQGILLFYNGKNAKGAKGDQRYTGNSYCAGQALFSLKEPTHLIDRLDEPFFKPEASFEKSGQYPDGTVFIEGLVPFHGKWYLYYGCADSRVSVAVKQ